MDIKDILTHAKALALKGNIKRSIEILSNLRGSNYEGYHDILSGRFKMIETRKQNFELSTDEYTVESNKLLHSILGMISSIEEEVKLERNTLDKVFDVRFKDKVKNTGKEIISNIINANRRNEKFLLSYLDDSAPKTVKELKRQTGYPRMKINRILRRLLHQNLVINIGNGWLRV